MSKKKKKDPWPENVPVPDEASDPIVRALCARCTCGELPMLGVPINESAYTMSCPACGKGLDEPRVTAGEAAEAWVKFVGGK
jgi:hypothetical protein